MAQVTEGVMRVSLIDHDGQTRQFSLRIPTSPPANPMFLSLWFGGFLNSILAVIEGKIESYEFLGTRTINRPPIRPTVATAQVNILWLVNYVDAVTNGRYSLRIPTADITDNGLLRASSQDWDATYGLWVTFVSKFEENVLSPNGNATNVQHVRLISK